jgi:hypothetical protein
MVIRYGMFGLRGESSPSSACLVWNLQGGTLVFSGVVIVRASSTPKAEAAAEALIKGGLEVVSYASDIDIHLQCAKVVMRTNLSPYRMEGILKRCGKLVSRYVWATEEMDKLIPHVVRFRAALPHRLMLARSLQALGPRKSWSDGGVDRLGLADLEPISTVILTNLMEVDCGALLDELLSCDEQVRYAWDVKGGARC